MELDPLKKVVTASMLKRLEDEAGFVKHEWEELVEKLSCSDDPKLRCIGCEEGELIRAREKLAKAP